MESQIKKYLSRIKTLLEFFHGRVVSQIDNDTSVCGSNEDNENIEVEGELIRLEKVLKSLENGNDILEKYDKIQMRRILKDEKTKAG